MNLNDLYKFKAIASKSDGGGGSESNIVIIQTVMTYDEGSDELVYTPPFDYNQLTTDITGGKIIIAVIDETESADESLTSFTRVYYLQDFGVEDGKGYIAFSTINGTGITIYEPDSQEG